MGIRGIMHERDGLPGQHSRVTRLQVMENTGYLGVSSQQFAKRTL